MDPHDAKVQLTAAHDNAEPANSVSRLRDLVMLRYDRQLLCAVYDGELNLYDTLTYTKIDVTAGRLRYEAHPESYLPATRYEQGVTPDAREPATIDLTREQWDRMTGTQRHSALQGIQRLISNRLLTGQTHGVPWAATP